jgi:hypothetical protein
MKWQQHKESGNACHLFYKTAFLFNQTGGLELRSGQQFLLLA